MLLPLACAQMSIFIQNRVRDQNTSVFTVELFRKSGFSIQLRQLKIKRYIKVKLNRAMNIRNNLVNLL